MAVRTPRTTPITVPAVFRAHVKRISALAQRTCEILSVFHHYLMGEIKVSAGAKHEGLDSAGFATLSGEMFLRFSFC